MTSAWHTVSASHRYRHRHHCTHMYCTCRSLCLPKGRAQFPSSHAPGLDRAWFLTGARIVSESPSLSPESPWPAGAYAVGGQTGWSLRIAELGWGPGCAQQCGSGWHRDRNRFPLEVPWLMLRH